MTYLTPLMQYDKAAAYFEQGGAAYHFSVPDKYKMESYIQRMREYAKRDGVSWLIAYNVGRSWIVKIK